MQHIYILVVSLLFFLTSALASITPEKVIVTVSPKVVFSHPLWDDYRAEVTITVFDSVGNTVPENTPVVIRTARSSGYLYDTLYSAQQFKVNYDPSYYNYYFFWTDAEGKISARYAGRTVVFPGDSLMVYVSAFAVRFSDPNDPGTASYTGPDLLDAANSTTPIILVGVSNYTITVYGRNGDHYVSEAYNAARRDSTRITVRFFDTAGRRVPPNVPVGINTYKPDVWGTLEGPNILHRDTIPASVGFPEERHYFFQTDINGEIDFTYLPPNTGMANLGYDKSYLPWHIWYENSKDGYATREEAFAAWENARTVPLDFKGAKSVAGSWSFFSLLSRSSGKPPVLVGPSLVRFQTSGSIFGSRYLFTNESRVERARVIVQIYDDLDRPVPSGTPIALVNAVITADASGTCYPFVHGRVYQSSPYPVEYAPNECGDPNFWAIIRAGENGTVQLTVDPPFASLRSEIPHWGNYDDPYLVPYFHRLVNTLRLPQTDDSQIPILTSAYDATIRFEPPMLGPGKIFSRARVNIYDTQGRPVPRGANLLFQVDKGFIFGVETGNTYLKNYVMQPGRVMVPYISPTRSLGSQITATLQVNKTVHDPWGQGYKVPLAAATIQMEGIAYSPLDPSISKLIFGKSLSDILADLNPLKALGSMRNMADRAAAAREARKRLLQLAASSDASDEEIQQAYQDFRQKFGDLAHSIAGFIKDVPGTSFDPNFPLTAQGTVSDILEKGLRRYYQDQLMNKFKSELEGQVNDFVTHQVLKPVFNLNKSTLNQQRPRTLVGDYLQTEMLTPLHFLEGETGMFKVYAFRFRVSGFGDRSADAIFQTTEQYPLSAYLFPEEMFTDIAPGQPLIAPGIMEVESIVDSQTVDFVAMGIICAEANIFPDLVSEAVVADTADTSLTWLDGNGVQLPASALDFTAGVQDSVQLFLLPLTPPNPVRQEDSTVVHYAYALGHFTLPDSTIQPLTFAAPGTFLIDLTTIYPDSALLPEQFKPYRYNESTGQWEELSRLPGYDSTVVAFSVTSTGIYGVGGQTASAPVISIRSSREATIPKTLVLTQNYPNPFNGNTIIRYYLPRPSAVILSVYDIQGRLIRTLVEGSQKAGWHQIHWDGRNGQGTPVSSGMYFYQLKAKDFRKVKKMLLVQ